MKKVMTYMLVAVMAIMLAACASKQPIPESSWNEGSVDGAYDSYVKYDPNQTEYETYLHMQRMMNSPEKRTVETLKISGITEMKGDIEITRNEIIPAVPLEKPTSWKDVWMAWSQPFWRVAELGLKTWGVLEFTDLVIDGINDGFHVVEQDKIEVVEGPGQIIEVPGDTEIITVPGDPIIIDQPVIVEVPTPWIPPPNDGPIDLNIGGELDVNITNTPAP